MMIFEALIPRGPKPMVWESLWKELNGSVRWRTKHLIFANLSLKLSYLLQL